MDGRSSAEGSEAVRTRAVGRFAVGLLLTGLAAGLALLSTLGAEWGADLRERRIALAAICLGALAAGAALMPLRRRVAERLIPLLAGAFTLAAIFALVVAVDMVRAYRLLTTPNPRELREGRCHERDARLGWVHTPGVTCRHALEGNFDAIYRIDAKGFRATPVVSRPERRILFFGDSYTFGHGVSNEETFVNVIAERYVDDRVQLVNAGVNGYGLVAMYGSLLQQRNELGPGDLVVFSPISHDLGRNLDDIEALVPWVFGRGPFPRWEDGELREDRIGSLGDRVWALLVSGPVTRDLFRFLRRALYAPPNVRQAHEILDAARSVVEERGARFALLFLPRVNEIRRGRFMFDVSSFEYPDIRGHFPQDEEELARHRFPDDGHWNARGHRVAARAVVAALVDAGLIETSYLREPGADS